LWCGLFGVFGFGSLPFPFHPISSVRSGGVCVLLAHPVARREDQWYFVDVAMLVGAVFFCWWCFCFVALSLFLLLLLLLLSPVVGFGLVRQCAFEVCKCKLLLSCDGLFPVGEFSVVGMAMSRCGLVWIGCLRGAQAREVASCWCHVMVVFVGECSVVGMVVCSIVVGLVCLAFVLFHFRSIPSVVSAGGWSLQYVKSPSSQRVITFIIRSSTFQHVCHHTYTAHFNTAHRRYNGRCNSYVIDVRFFQCISVSLHAFYLSHGQHYSARVIEGQHGPTRSTNTFTRSHLHGQRNSPSRSQQSPQCVTSSSTQCSTAQPTTLSRGHVFTVTQLVFITTITSHHGLNNSLALFVFLLIHGSLFKV
jgi:hypothetical protein